MKQIHVTPDPVQFRSLANIFLIIAGAAFLAFGQAQTDVTSVAALSDADVARVRSIVEAAFAAYEKRDIERLKLLWNVDQPASKAQLKETEKLFAASGRIAVGPVSFIRFLPSETGAVVRVRASLNSVDAASNKQGLVFDSENRLFTLTRQAASWKIIRHESVETNLANALARLKTDNERSLLIEANSDIDMHAFLLAIHETVRRTRIDENNVPLSNEILEFVLPIAQRSDDRLIYTKFLSNIGAGKTFMGDLVGAEHILKQALSQFPPVNDPALESSISLNLSVIYNNLGNYTAAIRAAEKRLSWVESVGDRDAMLSPLINISNSYGRLGDHFRQIEIQTRALGLLKELSQSAPSTAPSVRAAALLNGIANAYFSLGYEEQAVEHLTRAKKIRDDLKNPDFGILISLGNIFRRSGNYAQALQYYEAAFRGFEGASNKGGMASAVNSIGQVYLLQEKYSEALEFHSKALKIRLESKLPTNPNKLRVAYDQFLLGDLSPALTTAEAIIALPRLRDDDLGSSAAYSLAGRIYRSMGLLDKSESYLREAINIAEKRRSSLAGNENVVLPLDEGPDEHYTALTDLLIERNRVDEALAISERLQLLVLLDILINGKHDITGSMTAEERSEERRLRDEIVSLNRQISVANRQGNVDADAVKSLQAAIRKKRTQFEGLQLQILAAHPELRVKRGEMKPVDGNGSGELLRDTKSAIVKLVVAKDRAFGFLVGKDAAGKPTIKVYPISVTLKELTTKIEKYRTTLAVGDLDFQKQSRELNELLLKPAESQLAGKTNIIIVPDGPLWDLPFQALIDEKGKYLIEKAAVSYAPSLTALREMQKKAKTRQHSADAELLAFGNPIVGKETKERVQRVFMSEKLEPLPEAERLVKELGVMYGPKRSKIFVGPEAREETAKKESPNYRIVQFATHGILNNVSPMYSHLVFAQNEKNPNEDGLLEAWELKDLDLKADMIILSACDTARGRIANGEGIIGMTWASFIAGAPTTVATQWKVESSSTTELMLEFHRQLLAKRKVSKAEALRRASLKVMKMPKYRHPSYWAGFVIVGDAS
ncbi:MAG: CHAT domain-containing protein [Chloracidobacterium sp.]|nr:CHAT domain-containing protein [Chloracidobacterium sp.]